MLGESRLGTLYLYEEKTFVQTFLIHFLKKKRLNFFCSGIQFYLLLSPYFCFISILYLDLYALRDDALIS